MSAVSLFMSHKYNDKILSEDAETITVEYCGQAKGGRDYLIGVGAFLFIKEKKGYKLAGRVNTVQYKGIENRIKVFILVIQKEKEIMERFRIKNDICQYFGWPELNSFQITHGIIEHK
jgi:hypothetical protein